MEKFRRFISLLRDHSFPQFGDFIKLEFIDDRDTFEQVLKRMASEHTVCVNSGNEVLAESIRDEIKKVYKMANTKIASMIYYREVEKLREGGMPFNIAEQEMQKIMSKDGMMVLYLPALNYAKRTMTPTRDGRSLHGK